MVVFHFLEYSSLINALFGHLDHDFIFDRLTGLSKRNRKVSGVLLD